MRKPIVALALMLLGLGAGCSGPRGAAGLRWGEDVSAALRRHGWACGVWQPWFRDDLEQCAVGTTVRWRSQAQVIVFQRAGRLVGVRLWFRGGVDWRTLGRQVIRDFAVAEDPGWERRTLVHSRFANRAHLWLERLGPSSCALTVLAPRIAGTYDDYDTARRFLELLRQPRE